MKINKWLIYSSVATFIIAAGMFLYTVSESKALSYLSSDSKTCINCHVMNTQYATWKHSPHAQRAGCVDCHLPAEAFFGKYMAKSRDGRNHSIAFTFNTYPHAIKISENGANRVQKNCIFCHSKVVENMLANAARYQDLAGEIKPAERKCWDCHQDIAHGKTRSLITTPNALSVRREVN